MHPIEAVIENPVKVSVGVILVVLFGIIAMWIMPIQLSPDVELPVVSVTTQWPGASPLEIEKEIVQAQEEQLQNVEGVVKISSECRESQGTITLEFGVGTNLQEAVLKVNSQLQQVRNYPLDAERPVIRTADNTRSQVAWFVLMALPPDDQLLRDYATANPAAAADVERVFQSRSAGLKNFRIREFVAKYPDAEALLPPDLDIPSYRKFAEDYIKSEFERVPGVAGVDVFGGRPPQMQVIVNAEKLAARGLTMADVRDALNSDNTDISGGKFYEGKRGWTVRTLGEYRSEEQIGSQIIRGGGTGPSVYLRDVAEIRLDYGRPTGFVRRFGISNLSIGAQRQTGANVMDVMQQLQAAAERLNETRLKREGLVLSQVYDETEYITSSIGLVNQNIMLGSALTIIIMILFLHVTTRALLVVPLLAISSALAVWLSPWFFVLTLAIILVAGVWFARGALVVAIAIPTSIVGTFLILNFLGRSLNVISLAGLAFAVGMLVDNAVVVLENVYRYHQKGEPAFRAARLAAIEVWGAVLASTLTTLFVFLPVLFLQDEIGQLFADIALAISAAVGLSLLVSVLVIPTAAARILADKPATSTARVDSAPAGAGASADQDWAGSVNAIGSRFTDWVCNINAWIQATTARRIGVVLSLLFLSVGTAYVLLPEMEYLPEGNRNLIRGFLSPPPGYNVEKMAEMGQRVEEKLRPNWDFNNADLAGKPPGFVGIDDFFYVANDNSVFMGLRAHDGNVAHSMIPMIREQFKEEFPGTFFNVSQTSLFGRGLSGGRSIDIEIVGPDLEKLVMIGGKILGQVRQQFPETTQVRPRPSLDLANPELHVVRKPEQGSELGISNVELGFVVSTLVDGAYIADYFHEGEKLDMVLRGNDSYTGYSQDLAGQYIATRNARTPVRLDALAEVKLSAGPDQILRRERQRAVTIEVTPSPEIPLEAAIRRLRNDIILPLEQDGTITTEYQVNLSGTADKLVQTWSALRWNFLLALLITYLLMAALFESWLYPLVIIVSVPLGAVGGIIGLRLLGGYLYLIGGRPQALDVLTMLGFVILIGTVVNNAILLVHQSLNLMRLEQKSSVDAILESIRTRIRPIFMTTLTTVFGLAPLVFFPGAGSELYRGIGSVIFGGLIVSTVFTLVMIPSLFSLVIDLKTWVADTRASLERQTTATGLPAELTTELARQSAL